MKTKMTSLRSLWTSCRNKTMLASAAMLLAATPLAAQYYMVEDFASATPGFYGFYPVSDTSTDNPALKFGLGSGPDSSIAYLAPAVSGNPDAAISIPGQNYWKLNTVYTAAGEATPPYSALLLGQRAGLSTVTFYTAASYSDGSDIDFPLFYNLQMDAFPAFRYSNPNLGSFDPAQHGYKIELKDSPSYNFNSNLLEASPTYTNRGVWNKTVFSGDLVQGLDVARTPNFFYKAGARGTIHQETIYDTSTGEAAESADLPFTTSIILGLVVYKYDTKPAWAPTTTQSQTITLSGESGNVGNKITAATSATDRTVSFIVTDPSIAKPDGNGGLDLLADGTTTVLAYVTNDANYDGAIREFTLSVGTLAATNEAEGRLNVQIVPNPASDIFSINGLKTKADITITDLSGRKVWQQTTADGRINVSGLAKGTYVVQISADGKQTSQKLIKK